MRLDVVLLQFAGLFGVLQSLLEFALHLVALGPVGEVDAPAGVHFLREATATIALV